MRFLRHRILLWLDQIRARGDHYRYAGQPVTLIGMDFSREQRNLAGFAWERA